jgi:hypothetical protein
LHAQEKVPKEKGTPAHSSADADVLRSSPIRGRAQLAISLRSITLKQGARLNPGLAAVLGECHGFWVLGFGFWVLGFGVEFNPVGAAEHRRDFEGKRATLSSWIC